LNQLENCQAKSKSVHLSCRLDFSVSWTLKQGEFPYTNTKYTNTWIDCSMLLSQGNKITKRWYKFTQNSNTMLDKLVYVQKFWNQELRNTPEIRLGVGKTVLGY
jgi:hypothetical protein